MIMDFYNRLRADEVMPCVIIPIYRLPLTDDELTSLHHLNKHLSDYSRIVIGPKSLGEQNLKKYGSSVSLWDDRHFQSDQTYSRLMMTADFYEEYSSWTHMLVYQLDCLIFSDQLFHWCNSAWDYIGSPWFPGFLEKNLERGLWAVGNGGFSLRNIRTFLKVLRSSARDGIYRKPYDPPHHGLLPNENELTGNNAGLYKNLLPQWERWFLVNPGWTVEQELQRYMYNEDAFWSFEASKFYPDFRVAPVEAALKFAFEMNPDWCFTQNGNKLPFGCHAWPRYNRAFWEKVIQ